VKKTDTFIVMDTETGGFDARANSILSLGAVIVRNRQVLPSNFYILINEGETYNANEGAIKVNGITEAMTREHGVAPATAVRSLKSWMAKSGLNWGVVAIGANIGFDVPFVKRLFTLGGQPYDKLFSHRTMDVQSIAAFLEQAGHFDLKGQSASLDNLCKLLNVPIARDMVHNALSDATATAQVYLKLLDLLNIREG
jgi:DNA polymerase-3 subunit epsilon